METRPLKAVTYGTDFLCQVSILKIWTQVKRFFNHFLQNHKLYFLKCHIKMLIDLAQLWIQNLKNVMSSFY